MMLIWKYDSSYLPMILFCWQFFLRESHLGQNRASCSLQQLCLLNPRVQVSAHTGPLAEELLRQFQVRWTLNVMRRLIPLKRLLCRQTIQSLM